MRLSVRAAAAVLAAAVLAVTSLVAGTPAGAGQPYRLQMAELNGTRVPMRWNPCQDAITYKVNTTYAREKGQSKAVARSHARQEMVSAMDQVARLTGLPLTYTGTTSQIPTGANWWRNQDTDSEIVLAYIDSSARRSDSTLLAPGAWGQGGQIYKYDETSLVVGRGFAVFDADKAIQLKPGFGRGDHRGNLVLHEIGHVMGLDHVSNRSQLMNPVLLPNGPDGFAAGDREGLRRVGTEGGCIADADLFWPGS